MPLYIDGDFDHGEIVIDEWPPFCNATVVVCGSASHRLVALHETWESLNMSHDVSAANLSSLSAIIEAMPDAVVIVDGSARVRMLNESASILLGGSPSDIVGQLVEPFVHLFLRSEHEHLSLEDLRTELYAGRSVRGETTNLSSNGRSLRIQWSVAPIKDSQGQLAHYVAVLRDVTAEYERQRTTEEGRQFLRSTLDAICAHVAVISPSGTILTVNEAWRASDQRHADPALDPVGTSYLAGYCLPEADGEDALGRIQEGLQSVIDGRLKTFYYEYACRHQVEPRWASVRLAAFHEPPPCRVVAAHLDITQRKSVEQRVQRRLEGQHVLSNLMARVLDRSTDHGETAMVEALRAVSTFLGADRTYVVMLDEDRSTLLSVRAFSSPNVPDDLAFPIDMWRAAIRGDVPAAAKCGEFIDVVMSHLRPDETFRVESIHAPPVQSTERRILEAHGLRSIVCVPIVHARRVVGFGGIDMIREERSWSDENVDFLRSAFDVLGTATSRWRAEELLRSILEGMASSSEESFLDVLVEQICFGLGVDHAFVAEIVDDKTARILAFAGLPGPFDNVTMHLAGTPAEDLAVLGEPCIYRKNVRAQFPNDELLAQCNTHAYAGVPLMDATGQVIGFITIMHGRLLGATKLTMDVLRVFAGRAASEIDRRRKGDALVALNHALEGRVAERAAVAARQAAAMDATTEGMAIMAGDVYVYMNDAHAQMYGYESGSSLLGHSWRELYYDGERQRLENDAFTTLERDRKFRGEFIGKRRDGSTFDLHLSLSFAEGGDIICCCQDITEQKGIQTELSAHRDELRLANIELSRAAQHKDEFLASMSHELRTPLNGILGMTEILLEQIVGKLDEKQLSCLRVVDESGKHLLSLINDILDLSKIEAGALGLELSMVDARAVCEASLRVVRPAADAKKHKVNFNCPVNPGHLRVDERRVKQMLVNLLDNAIKFTPSGGFLGVDIEDRPERGDIAFVVWDNGIGIAIEHQPRLFKPFSQIELGLARQHSGTGLGLSLVKRLAELHGGSVSVESNTGRGSRFTISLPRGNGPIPVPMVRSITPGRPNRAIVTGAPTILVVDDNVPNLTMLRDYLAIKGFDVITAQSGQEALEIADQTSVSAILMDIQMPGMDGLVAIRSLRSNSRHSKVPILATTAHVMPGDRERCLAAGATEYLAKPLSPRQIITILLRILEPVTSLVP